MFLRFYLESRLGVYTCQDLEAASFHTVIACSSLQDAHFWLCRVMTTADYSQWQAVSASILQPSHCLLKESYVTLSYEPYKSRFSMQKGSLQHVENVKHSPKDNLYCCLSTTKLNTALICINLFSLHKQAKKTRAEGEVHT